MLTNCWYFNFPYGETRMDMQAAFAAEHSYRTGESRYHVEVRSGPHWGCDIRTSTNDLVKLMPGNKHWVFQADIANADGTTLPQEAGYELVPCSNDSDITLLMVRSDARVESFDLRSKPHFNKCNIWVGADGPGLMLSAGPYQSPNKKQLFRLHEGESVLFFDAKKEVTKITANVFGKQPICVRASNGEVADYVLSEARKRGKNPSSRAWCFYTLQELGCQHQLDAFSRQFRNFHRK